MEKNKLNILNKKFSKDYNVPIQIFDEPYFSERLKLFGFYEKYQELLEIVKNDFNDDIEQYLDYHNNLKETIISYIKDSQLYKEITKVDMRKYSVNVKFNKSDVFKDFNIGHSFLSIDLSKANFNVFVKYAKENNLSFFDEYDYNKFMKQFTKYDYLINSKNIRQVVFGNCGPGIQSTLEHYCMWNFTKEFLDSFDFLSEKDIYSLREDELILNIDRFSLEQIQELMIYAKELSKDYLPIEVECYMLGKISGTEAYVKKNLFNQEFKLKCVNPYEAPFIYRFIRHEDVQDIDLYFYNKPYIAKFVTYPLDIKIDFSLK